MTLPKIVAVNLTGGNILLTRLGLVVPASSSLELTLYAFRDEILNDESLFNEIDSGNIVLSYGHGNLTKGDSLKFFNLITEEVRISVRALSDANIASLSGTTTIDSVSVAANDRVLLTAQSTGSQNGIWLVKAGAWVRPDDFAADQSAAGALVVVQEGTVYADQIWVCTSNSGSDIVGTSSLVFSQASGSSATTLQNAYENGNTIAVTSGEGDLAVTLTSANFTIDGANDLNIGGVTPLSNIYIYSDTLFSVSSLGTVFMVSDTDSVIIDGFSSVEINSTSSIDIGNSTSTAPISIGTGAAAKNITIGNSSSTTSLTLNAGTGAVNLATNATQHNTLLGSTTGTSALTLQTGSGTFTSTAGGAYDVNAVGAVTIDSSGAAISIGSDAVAQAINVGTGAAARTITIGNATGATSLVLNAGTGAVNLASNATQHNTTLGSTSGTSALTHQTGTGAMTFTAGGVFDVNATGAVTLDSSGAAISIGSDAVAQAINVGTGAAARTITIGNGTGATSLVLNAGTGAVNLGSNATDHTTTLGSTSGTSAATIQSGTGAMTFTAGGVFDVNATGAVTVDGTGISIDGTSASNLSTTSADLTLSTISSGTLAVTSAAALNLSSTTGDWQASGALTLDSSGGAISIGSDANSQAINVGTGAAARTITIGNGTGATSLVLNAGTGAINIGTNAVAHTTTVGSTTGASATTIQSGTGNVTITAPTTTISGDLIVQGSTITSSTENIIVADNHIYLNAGYNTVAAQTGGLIVNYLPTSTTTTVNGNFVAGVNAVSNPTVITTGSATFSASDFIQISGATEASNNGLFEVLSHSGTTLTIRGIGVTATVEDFTQNQFTASSSVAGTIRKINVSIIRSGTDGVWETGFSATTPVTFSDLASASGTTLQQAYQNGNTISVTSGEGPLAITLSSDDFTVDGSNDVSFGGSTAVTTFNVDATGAITVDGAGISIDGTAASNLSVTSNNLTLSTITSGTLAVTSAGALNLSSTTGDWQASGALTIDSSGGAISIGSDANAQAINVGTGAAARTITIGNGTGATSLVFDAGTGAVNIATNATQHNTTLGTTTGTSALTHQTGTGAMTFTAGGIFDVNATGAVTVDGTGISIDGTSASNLSTTGADLTLSTITSGTLAVTSAGALNLSSTTGDWQASGALTIDSSGGAISIGSDAVAQAINVGTGAAARTITVGNNTGATALILNSGTEQVQIDGVTYYGASSGNPTARGGGFQDGDKYYDTSIDMEMRYDAGRSKWLSVESQYFAFGRQGATMSGQYYRAAPEGRVMSSTEGFFAPYNGTVVALGYTREDTDAVTFDIVAGGSSLTTVASSAAAGKDNALNANFSQDDIIAVRNQAAGNTTDNVIGWVKLKWRA